MILAAQSFDLNGIFEQRVCLNRPQPREFQGEVGRGDHIAMHCGHIRIAGSQSVT